MVFTLKEIKYYLEQQKTIHTAIQGLSEQAIINCIPYDDFDSLNFSKNEKNLLKYENKIGMAKRKEEQITLYRNTDGKRGRYWMACNPRWNTHNNANTKYGIDYWVNYGDDSTYGWFTVEQIQSWFDNPKIQLHELGGTKER